MEGFEEMMISVTQGVGVEQASELVRESYPPVHTTPSIHLVALKDQVCPMDDVHHCCCHW